MNNTFQVTPIAALPPRQKQSSATRNSIRKPKAPTIKAKQWKPCEPRIRQLFVEQGASYKRMAEIINKEFGLLANERQYKQKIHNMALKRNAKEGERQKVVKHVKYRQSIGKQHHHVRVRGHDVSNKLARWMNEVDTGRELIFSRSPSPLHSCVSICTNSRQSTPTLEFFSLTEVTISQALLIYRSHLETGIEIHGYPPEEPDCRGSLYIRWHMNVLDPVLQPLALPREKTGIIFQNLLEVTIAQYGYPYERYDKYIDWACELLKTALRITKRIRKFRPLVEDTPTAETSPPALYVANDDSQVAIPGSEISNGIFHMGAQDRDSMGGIPPMYVEKNDNVPEWDDFLTITGYDMFNETPQNWENVWDFMTVAPNAYQEPGNESYDGNMDFAFNNLQLVSDLENPEESLNFQPSIFGFQQEMIDFPSSQEYLSGNMDLDLQPGSGLDNPDESLDFRPSIFGFRQETADLHNPQEESFNANSLPIPSPTLIGNPSADTFSLLPSNMDFNIHPDQINAQDESVTIAGNLLDSVFQY